MYKAGARTMYGVEFPDGLRANEKLPWTIITPTTKAGHGAHDAPLSAQDIIERRHADPARNGTTSRKRRSRCSGAAARSPPARGLILADTKYEFGFNAEGHIVLADEIHTPDSSRYWLAESYAERLARGTAAREPRQGFHPQLGGGALRSLSRPHPAEIPPEVVLRRRRGLYPRLRDHHRPRFRRCPKTSTRRRWSASAPIWRSTGRGEGANFPSTAFAAASSALAISAACSALGGPCDRRNLSAVRKFSMARTIWGRRPPPWR